MSSSTHLAAYHGSVPILEELLRKDVDLTKRDIRGMQPHHLAAFRKQSLPCLKAILDKRNDLIDSPVQREQTQTTLRHDVSDSYGHNHNVLTNLNALKQLEDEGYTPLYRAIKSGCVDCVQALLETTDDNDYKLTLKEKELTILHAAIEFSSNRSTILQKIEFLMKTNSPESISVLNQTNSEGLTAVDLAAKNGEPKCLDVLFKYDNINVIPENIDKKKHYDTLVHHAAKKVYYKILDIILPRCEDLIDMLDSNCLTALLYAAHGGYPKFVELLLKRGANVAIKDPFVNRTAIDIIMSNVPRALEIIEDVLDSFIVPIKNTAIVEDTTENNNNDNNDGTTNQEQISLLNSITNNEHNRMNDLNSSVSQVAIDMSESDVLTTEDNVQDNSVELKNSHQQTKVTTDILKKNENQQKHKTPNTKQIPLNTTQQQSPLTKNNNNNEHYTFHMINLDYKCLVAGSRELEVIEAVNKCKHDKLKQLFFLHPIVKTFLIYKWKKIKNLHLILLCVYLIHTLSVTGLAICTLEEFFKYYAYSYF